MLLDLGADVNAIDDNGDTPMHGAAYGAYPTVVKLLAERGANPQIWKEKNKFGRTPLFIAEGYQGRLPRPDVPTIEAVTKLMVAAGLSTDGERPPIVDIYEKMPEPTRTFKTEKRRGKGQGARGGKLPLTLYPAALFLLDRIFSFALIHNQVRFREGQHVILAPSPCFRCPYRCHTHAVL